MEGRVVLQGRGREVSDEDLQQQKDDEGRVVLQGRGCEVSDEDLQQQKDDEGRVVLQGRGREVSDEDLQQQKSTERQEAFDRVIATMAARSYSNSSILPERHLTGSSNW
ncbi:hypothetical protein BD769DRAFT_1681803 [Suillus cothurnatus]|nr:hypothetical protein BD769DRAFT_1681803 [Suillus cothurnatus]